MERTAWSGTSCCGGNGEGDLRRWRFGRGWCGGFEARGHGHSGAKAEAPATVLNSLMGVVRVAGKIGIPGLYVTEDPGAVDAAAGGRSVVVNIRRQWQDTFGLRGGASYWVRPELELGDVTSQALAHWRRKDRRPTAWSASLPNGWSRSTCSAAPATCSRAS